MLMQLEG